MRFSIQICLVWAIGGVLMMFAQGKKLVSSGQWRDPYYDNDNVTAMAKNIVL